MRMGLVVGAAAASIALRGVMPANASPEFRPYEGRNAIHEGQGGEKKIVEGIDFWSNGDPPHRFKVLGAISDRRMKTGLYGMIRMSGLDSDIAKAARAAGGDAVIIGDEGDDVLGVSGSQSTYVNGSSYSGSFSGTGFGTSFSHAVKAHVSRYIVVQYLPDDPPATAVAPKVPGAITQGQSPPTAPAVLPPHALPPH